MKVRFLGTVALFALLTFFLLADHAPDHECFLRGDSNGDGELDVSDAVHVLFVLFDRVPYQGDVCFLRDRSATVTWDAPTTNADGTPLDDLAGYLVYRKLGSEPCGSTEEEVRLTDVDTTAVTFETLVPGLHFFRVTAVDHSGNESVCSETVSKIIQ